MANSPSPDVQLVPLNGDPRPIEDWVTVFHLVIVVLDPYTYESGWLIDTAGRILRSFVGADCRVSFLVTGTTEEAAEFLGPWSEEILTFADPDRQVVQALGLQTLPAVVHLDHQLGLNASVEGWDPQAWQDFAKQLAQVMSWSAPTVPAPGDPVAFAGTPATGG